MQTAEPRRRGGGRRRIALPGRAVFRSQFPERCEERRGPINNLEKEII